MVPQDPFTSLDPSFTIGNQLADPFRMHGGLQGVALRRAIVASLERVGISSAAERTRQYPHQLSGGMSQRVVSSIALAAEPEVLLADEPTTALDMTTQAQYLYMLRQLQERIGFALLLITHNLLVVRHMCERVVVMYAGQVVEQGLLEEVFVQPKHPYTKALWDAIPDFDQTRRLISIEGQAPNLTDPVVGCRFAPRCKFAREICKSKLPALSPRPGDERTARCWGTEPGGWIGA
jgi:oligopeptide/dipeptide ABC transporter ATP-binding protein